ncbi:MAG: hypothetical protein H0V75_06925 [Rubrobacter sp.]|nr:hypothetical protein [Rubrobacter sp.]
MASLEASATWRKLDDGQKSAILASSGLKKRPRPKVESGAAVLDSLAAASLSEWENLALALENRFGKALTEAARMLEPKAVKVRPGAASLASEDEVEEYLEGLREEILGHIREGRPVIL